MTIDNKLKRLTIRGFQSIRQLEDFHLGDINVLIGANGAGKSNFINYFRMLGELVEKRLNYWVNKRGGANRLLTFGVKETPQLVSQLWFEDNSYRFVLEPTDDGGFVFAQELFHVQTATGLHATNDPVNAVSSTVIVTENGVTHDLKMGHKESLLRDQPYEIAQQIYRGIASWKAYHFHDTGETARVKRPWSIHDARYLKEDAANLAAYLYRVRNLYPDSYQKIRRVVQLAIPFFDDFVLEPETIAGGEQQIRLLWRQQNSDYRFSPAQLSDGSLRFICLATALSQPEPPAAIILDEPELGLHPYAITLLGSLIRSASTRMQIILSTQSVPLLNEFQLEDLIVVEREADVSVFRRLDAAAFAHWLEDYTLGELWEQNILGGRP